MRPEEEDLIAKERDKGNIVIVPERMRQPHPLVVKYLDAFRQKAIEVSPNLRRAAGRTLAVVVTPQQLDRAMLLMDTVIKALESRGHIVEVTDPAHPPLNSWNMTPNSGWPWTRTQILGAWAYFDLREGARYESPPIRKPAGRSGRASDESSMTGLRTEVATGAFKLRVLDFDYTSQVKVWKDTPKRRVEECINAFIVGLLRSTVVMRERRERIARDDAARRDEAKWIEARRREVQEEAAWVADLESRVRDRQTAQHVREFVSAMERDAIERGEEIGPASDLARWIVRARAHADRLEKDAIRTGIHQTTTRKP